ncbi:MAG: hypothetical protein KGL32_01230 [candidate division NC10 bacterium]|nr:hypothetical protein [candidate division NC10 bacterium]
MDTEKRKTTFLLDKQLHAALRIKAIKEGTTLAALLEEAARQFLEREVKRVAKNRR